MTEFGIKDRSWRAPPRRCRRREVACTSGVTCGGARATERDRLHPLRIAARSVVRNLSDERACSGRPEQPPSHEALEAKLP